MQHVLKCWIPYFQAVLDGRKAFEFRKDDRSFMVGDTLHLCEFMPAAPSMPGAPRPHDGGTYTGRSVLVHVDYVMRGPELGLPVGYAVMGIRRDTNPQPPASPGSRSTAMPESVGSGLPFRDIVARSLLLQGKADSNKDTRNLQVDEGSEFLSIALDVLAHEYPHSAVVRELEIRKETRPPRPMTPAEGA